MSDIAIQTDAVSRVYKTYVKPEGVWGSVKGFWQRQHQERVALKPTTLEVKRGQIVGLVGANGAGKTTLLKVLSGLIHPSSGQARVLGYNPWERDPRFLRRMSLLLGQKNQLWWDLTPNDSYRLLAEIYDLDRTTARKKVAELAEILGASSVLETQLRRLSLGERMKMEIIGALLHEPEILFLDEPTIGLDIVAQTAIRRFLADYAVSHHPTIILTSHYMDDITKLADRLLLISQGEIIYDGTVPGFIEKSEIKKIVKFGLAEPLLTPMPLVTGQVLAAGEQTISIAVAEHELAPTLAQVTSLQGISALQIEERDFEDVIREFLEKESRLFPARRDQQSGIPS